MNIRIRDHRNVSRIGGTMTKKLSLESERRRHWQSQLEAQKVILKSYRKTTSILKETWKIPTNSLIMQQQRASFSSTCREPPVLVQSPPKYNYPVYFCFADHTWVPLIVDLQLGTIFKGGLLSKCKGKLRRGISEGELVTDHAHKT